MSRSTLGLLALLCAGAAACTVDNPNYRSISFDAAGTGANDLAVSDANVIGPGSPDLAKPPVVDLLVPPECVPGQLFCNDNKVIGCEQGKFVVVRYCPQGSICSDGSCLAPMSNPAPGLAGSTCESSSGPIENWCLETIGLDLSCQPFLDGTDVTWSCAPAIGNGVPTTPCTDGLACRSGFCGDNGTCFRACTEDQDCPPFVNNTKTKCSTVSIWVEGHKISAKSCIPD